MQIIDRAATMAALPFDRLIFSLAEAFQDDRYVVPTRQVCRVAGADEQDGMVLVMPAWIPGAYFGIKTVAIYPGNQHRGLPGLHSTFMLHDATTGAPLAVMNGDEITSRRTAAVSALVADKLSRKDAKSLLVVGAGRVASLLPEAYAAVRDIDRVYVWDINKQLADALVERILAQGIHASRALDLETIARSVDMISCATLSTQALIKGEWLAPGTHLDLIGSFTPAMKEADEVSFARASVFLDTEEAIAKSGDVIDALNSGKFDRNSVRGTLTDLCKGIHTGRSSVDEITLFKAVGNAREDLAAAVLALNLHGTGRVA
jgi:ornithine cyclodeaminase/alanine dehydrogenase-like protein (mu-crystallin family)